MVANHTRPGLLNYDCLGRRRNHSYSPDPAQIKGSRMGSGNEPESESQNLVLVAGGGKVGGGGWDLT